MGREHVFRAGELVTPLPLEVALRNWRYDNPLRLVTQWPNLISNGGVVPDSWLYNGSFICGLFVGSCARCPLCVRRWRSDWSKNGKTSQCYMRDADHAAQRIVTHREHGEYSSLPTYTTNRISGLLYSNTCFINADASLELNNPIYARQIPYAKE